MTNGVLFHIPIKPVSQYVNGKAMKTNETNRLDQYFTSPTIAKHLVDTAYAIIQSYEGEKISDYTWVEPSAGEGSFYDCFPKKRIGIDTSPLRTDFLRADYLQYDLPPNTVVVGNPPFGHRGVMALNFINHSLNADYVCFILPMFFESRGKGSIKYRVTGFNLIHSEKLPQDSFFSYTTKKKLSVKCVFQVWSRHHKLANDEFSWYNNQCEEPFGDMVRVVTVSLAKNRECGKRYIYEEKADFYISSTFHNQVSIVEHFAEVKYKSGVAVVFTTESEAVRGRIRDVFSTVDWKKYATLATNSCYHIGKSNIFQIIQDNIGFINN